MLIRDNRDDREPPAAVLERARRFVAAAEPPPAPPRSPLSAAIPRPSAANPEFDYGDEGLDEYEDDDAEQSAAQDPVGKVHSLRHNMMERSDKLPQPKRRAMRLPRVSPRFAPFSRGLDPLTAGAALVVVAVVGLAAFGILTRGHGSSAHTAPSAQDVALSATSAPATVAPAPTIAPAPTQRPVARVAPVVIDPNPSLADGGTANADEPFKPPVTATPEAAAATPAAGSPVAAAQRPLSTPPVTRPAVVASFVPPGVSSSVPPSAAPSRSDGDYLAGVVANASQAPPPVVSSVGSAPGAISSSLPPPVAASSAPVSSGSDGPPGRGSGGSAGSAAPAAAAPAPPPPPLAPQPAGVADQANRAAAAAAAAAIHAGH